MQNSREKRKRGENFFKKTQKRYINTMINMKGIMIGCYVLLHGPKLSPHSCLDHSCHPAVSPIPKPRQNTSSMVEEIFFLASFT